MAAAAISAEGLTKYYGAVVGIEDLSLDVATGEEGTANTNTDQPTGLGVVTVYRDNVFAVSFHRNGVAYTVTAADPDQMTWLLPILQSWQFTD